MSIRKIRASEAHVEADLIYVETRGSRVVNGSIGMMIGAVVSSMISPFPINILVVGLSTGLLGVLITTHKVIRHIPRSDLVEIKNYPDDERVTVVLDDERMKMPPRR